MDIDHGPGSDLPGSYGRPLRETDNNAHRVGLCVVVAVSYEMIRCYLFDRLDGCCCCLSLCVCACVYLSVRARARVCVRV